jgi:TonB family protein
MVRLLPIRLNRAALALLASALLIPAATAQVRRTLPDSLPRSKRASEQSLRSENGRLVQEKRGNFPVREGQRLRLVTDRGTIRIHTQDSPQLNYRVRLEATASQPDAMRLLQQFAIAARSTPEGVVIHGHLPGKESNDPLWVTFELDVPRRFQLDLSTQAGNIFTEPLEGRLVLFTAGGDIEAQTVVGPARLETRGGHITVQDVSGELWATTSGGHITVGNVGGDAVVRTAGGHVRVGHVAGKAQLESGGGNIFVQRAGSYVTASTAGGRIDFGEASGGVHARTAGGSIGVLRISGPTELVTSDGSIALSRVQGSVKASTVNGSIFAWLHPSGDEKRLPGPSQLIAGQGDIEVYIPRELPVTIDAVLEDPHAFRIEADPGIPIKFFRPDASGAAGRSVRAQAALNGGGELLKLKTTTGNIRLRWVDSAPDPKAFSSIPLPGPEHWLRHLEYRLRVQQESLDRLLRKNQETIEREIHSRLSDLKRKEIELGRWEIWSRRFSRLMSGRVRIAPDEMKHKVVHQVAPVYPPAARQQKLEGRVRLEIVVDSRGKVESVRTISGHPLLAQAAADAVRQWRYDPTLLEGKPVPVVTTLDFEFKLKD